MAVKEARKMAERYSIPQSIENIDARLQDMLTQATKMKVKTAKLIAKIDTREEFSVAFKTELAKLNGKLADVIGAIE